MRQNSISHVMLGLHLTPGELDKLRQATPEGVRLVNLDRQELPSRRELQDLDPLLVWVPWRLWRKTNPRQRGAFLRCCPSNAVLLLSSRIAADELESTLDHRLSVVRPPHGRNKLEGVMREALKTRGLYQDIFRMTQEILVERELLRRRNEQLTFINRFLSRLTETLDPQVILESTSQDLPRLLPLQSLQAVLWDQRDDGLEAHCFLAGGLDQAARDAWVELLLKSVPRLAGKEPDSFQILRLENAGLNNAEAPELGRALLLPLRVGGETFGCLALQANREYRLNRDQVELLHSTLNHLSLALKNALLFRKIKTQAEFDGLTRLHNRRHFDSRIVEELGRHQQGGLALSLLLVDLDHFKQINDLHGHAAGDMVLRETGRILIDQLRSTDYVARFGGEEFVAILPECPSDQAWRLAERLRKAIAAKLHSIEGQRFQVTASIGVATLCGASGPAAKPCEEHLLRSADESLYMAKSQGRNRVFSLDTGLEAMNARLSA